MINAIIEQMFIALPMLCGAYITLSLLKVPDFSIESAYLLGSVMGYLASDLPLPFIVASAAGGGMAVGATVSFFNQYLGIPYLLAAIVTNGLAHGMTLLILQGSVHGFHLETSLSEMHILVCVSAAIMCVSYFLFRTQMGYSFAIYGNNPHFFDCQQISKGLVLSFGVIIGHAFIGISGFLFSLTSGVIDTTMHVGIIMLCLTSLMIGKLIRRGDAPNSAVPLLGSIGYFFMQQTLLKLGLNLTYFNAFQAFIVLALLLLGAKRKSYTLDHLGV